MNQYTEKKIKSKNERHNFWNNNRDSRTKTAYYTDFYRSVLVQATRITKTGGGVDA